MPELCRFYGIVIRMFLGDHAPPHFHAEYAGPPHRGAGMKPPNEYGSPAIGDRTQRPP